MKEQMDQVLRTAFDMGASDIHITVAKPPCARIRGEMLPLTKFPVLNAEYTKKLIYGILKEEQIQDFETKQELDCSYFIAGMCRFRVNVLFQKGNVEAVLRVIPSKIPSAEEIGLDPNIMEFSKLPNGMVLVTGPTGSGKSTTLAALIDAINNNRKEHIITVEDPIEFVYEAKECVIRQREVGADTQSFNNALKHILRQDPDIVLVGEMRDLETISLALTAAETGHLVFGTLHTSDAAQTVDRVIDVFPVHQQTQVRVQLSAALKGVVSQTLLPTADGKGRAAAREVMKVTHAISNLIREGKTHQIYSAIDTGGKYGMISMDNSLLSLVQKRIITAEVATSKSHNPTQFTQRLASMGIGAKPAMGQRPASPAGR